MQYINRRTSEYCVASNFFTTSHTDTQGKLNKKVMKNKNGTGGGPRKSTR
jgi:hypothetical protein